MTLPDPHVPLNPGHVQDDPIEDMVLPPVTPAADAIDDRDEGESSMETTGG